MEILHLRSRIGKQKSIQYAKEHFPDDYYARFEELSYCVDMSHAYREKFTQGVSWLAMETGFREAAPKLDLLRSPEALAKYFKDTNNNPTLRLRKINELLKAKPWMVTKPVHEIAKAAGISYNEPASKQTVSDYMNYIAKLSGFDAIYTPGMVNDSPGAKALKDAFENARITNINHNFAENAEFLMNEEAMDWESNACDCVMIMSWPLYGDHEKLLEEAVGMKAEIAMVFFRRTGEKFVAFMTKEKAVNLVEGKLMNKTIMVKDDLYLLSSGEFILSKTHMPDLVYYDHPKSLQYRTKEADDKIKFSQHLHMGTTKDHPYRIIAFRINDQRPLHIANAFGSGLIADILKELGSRDVKIDNELLRGEYRNAINDYFGTMGLPWEIDWVAAITDQKDSTLHRR
jgi:hypothetical protein